MLSYITTTVSFFLFNWYFAQIWFPDFPNISKCSTLFIVGMRYVTDIIIRLISKSTEVNLRGPSQKFSASTY